MNSVFLTLATSLAALLALAAPAAAWESAGDASVLLQSSLQGQPGDERPLKHTLRCARGSTSGAPYLVEAAADVRGKGVGYYFTKSTKDRDLRTLAHWGTVVTGTEAGDGWLQVGDCYLPMTVEGKQVLKPVHQTQAPAKKPQSQAVQLKSEAPARPAVRPTAAPSKVSVPPHYSPGEAVEMISTKTKRYFASVVTGKGNVAGTYNLRIPTAPQDQAIALNIPVSAMRKPPNITEAQMGAAFAVGETTAFKVSTSRNWVKCIIQDRGRLPGTYTIYVPPGQRGHSNKTLTDIPAAWLRRITVLPGSARGAQVDSDVAAALQRLHASYAEIKSLLERDEREGS